MSTAVSPGRAMNKIQWDKKDDRRLGGSDGKLYIYGIGSDRTGGF